MSGELIRRLVRRAAVIGATLLVIGVAATTVKVAADWRTASAPLDTPPAGMATINTQLVAEIDRTGVLTSQVQDVASQIADLEAAVNQASSHVDGDTSNAQQLQAALDAATQKLTTLQAQLKAAQTRLDALNRAAANAAAAPAAPAGGGEPHDD